MRRQLALSATLATALSAAPSLAQAAPRALTIDDAVALALRTNPRLAAARRARRPATSTPAPPAAACCPSIHVATRRSYWNAPFAIAFPASGPDGAVSRPSSRDQETNTFVASSDQPLLGLFRANDERETLTEQSAADRAQIAAAEADLRQTVETQFLRVFEAQALEQIANASVHELGEQVTVAKARLASGVITQADLLRIEVAVANAEQQGLEAHSQGRRRARSSSPPSASPRPTRAELTLVAPESRLAPRAPRRRRPRWRRCCRRPRRTAPSWCSRRTWSWPPIARPRQDATRSFPTSISRGPTSRTDGQLFAPPNSDLPGAQGQLGDLGVGRVRSAAQGGRRPGRRRPPRPGDAGAPDRGRARAPAWRRGTPRAAPSTPPRRRSPARRRPTG